MRKKFDPYFFENKILIAMPGLVDPAYAKTVVFVVSYHIHEGALGFIINRPEKQANLKDLFLELNMPLPEQFHQTPPYEGGPDSCDSGHILHTYDRTIANSVYLTNKICFSTTQDVLKRISKNKPPKNFQIIFGRCIWKTGELEDEVKRNLWAVCDFNQNFLFQQSEPEVQWQQAFDSIGVDTRFLSPHIHEV